MKKFKRSLFSMFIAIILFLTGCATHDGWLYPSPNHSPSPSQINNEIYNYDNEGYDKTNHVGNIVVNSASEYEIVYPKEFTKTEYFSAEEMQNFILQSTGVRIRMIADTYANYSKYSKYISIGNTSILNNEIERENFAIEDEGFAISTLNSSVFIFANNGRGLIYGVYDFLEEYIGIKFLTDDVTYCPLLQKVELFATNRIENPDFKYRNYLNYCTFGNRILNEEDELLANKYTTRMRFTSEYMNNIDSIGGNINMFLGEWGATHNALNFVSPQIYTQYANNIFSDYKPFSEIIDLCYSKGIDEDGNIIDDGIENNTAIEIASTTYLNYIESQFDEIKKLDEKEVFFCFGQGDCDIGCNCEHCKAAVEKYGRSGIMIRFMNILVNNFNKRYSAGWCVKNLGAKVNFITFAYQYNIATPTDDDGNILDDTCIPCDNLYIKVAPLIADKYLSIDNENQTKYVPETGRVKRSFDFNYRKITTLYDEWSKVTNNLFSWNYVANFSDYYWYIDFLTNTKATLEKLHDNNITYVMLQSAYTERPLFFQYLNAYVSSQLMWDISENINELINEFCKYYFGEEAGILVENYINNYSQLFAEKFSKTGIGVICDKPKLEENIPTDFIKSSIDILNQAITSINTDTLLNVEEKKEYYNRIKKVLLNPQYMLLLRDVNYNYTSIEEAKADFFENYYLFKGKYYKEGHYLMENRFD